jgi:ketosteroid isomerase-like protein
MNHSVNNKALAKKFMKAINEGDLDTLETLVADDCRILQSDVSGKEHFVQHFKPDPELNFGQSVRRLIAEDNVVVIETTWHGNAVGPYFEYLLDEKPTGKRFELPMAWIMEFEDGLLMTLYEYYNELDLKRSLSE